MQRGFTKLFNTIVTSTIWQEDDKTRIVWITMLAIADASGIVSASIPGLANVSRVPVSAARRAIEKLLDKDPDSRTKDFDGRRIEAIDGGWRILNYSKYRRMLNEEERKEYKARWISEKRRQMSTKRRQPSIKSTQAEAEAEAEADIGANGSPPTTEDWLKSLEADTTYAGINVRQQYGKMLRWCEVNKKQPTQRRFINWLNRSDRPMNGTFSAPKQRAPVYEKLPERREPTQEEIDKAREIAKRETAKFRESLRSGTAYQQKE